MMEFLLRKLFFCKKGPIVDLQLGPKYTPDFTKLPGKKQ